MSTERERLELPQNGGFLLSFLYDHSDPKTKWRKKEEEKNKKKKKTTLPTLPTIPTLPTLPTLPTKISDPSDQNSRPALPPAPRSRTQQAGSSSARHSTGITVTAGCRVTTSETPTSREEKWRRAEGCESRFLGRNVPYFCESLFFGRKVPCHVEPKRFQG